MLKLKKLQILGFKSFCDRTELKFQGEGIAAIVGPNGCGKSNISDAISWVLGEQSAKTLRGSRMEDVIFAGTRERQPTGMAEVSLTLIDPERYDGDSSGDPEIEVRDELPPSAQDWDEVAERSRAAEETQLYTRQIQPGMSPEQEVPPEPSASPEGTPQVVLKIRRRKFQPAQFRAGEIVVTRRLFRSGESEYLLNGRLCRLRDIQDMFMGTGLGPESYALIEQGRIGQILSSKPTDRRAVIEEAAGITKFKARKRLAEARLEDARQNLARINDIFEEVTRQMNSLKRQASKAERYARLREEMRAKLGLVLASKFAQLEQESAALEAQSAAVAEDMRCQGEAVQQMEADHSAATQRGYAIESEARQSRDRANSLALEIDRAQARQRHNDERCIELATRSGSLQAEVAQTEQKLAALEREREGNRQLLASAAAEFARGQQDAARCQQEASQAASCLADMENQQEQRRSAILQTVAEASELRNQLTQSQERLAALERESQRLRQETGAARAQMDCFGGERGQLALQFESASQLVQVLEQEIQGSRRRLEAQRAAETESKARLDALRADYANAVGRKTSLQAMIAEHGYSTDSVRRLFQSGSLQGGLAPAGVLADFLEVDDRYERVVEDFLRDELNYIVVKSWDAADEGLRLLRNDVDGRATFLVHPEDAQARFSFAVDESTQISPLHHSILPLKNCIRVLNGFGKSLEVILPKLRHGYLVPDPGLARDLALENPDAFFLSRGGECFHNVTVTGGKQRAEGPLSIKRELRELMRHIAEVEAGLRSEEERVATLAREIAGLSSLLQRLEEEKRQGEKQAMTSGHTLQQLDSEMARLSERLATYDAELQRLAAERSHLRSRISEGEEMLAGREQQRNRLEQEMAAAQESLAALRERRDAATQSTSACQASVAALQERQRSAAASLERMEGMVAEVAARVEGLRLQVESAFSEGQRRQDENRDLAAQLTTLAAERAAAEAHELELQAESARLRARLSELDEQLRRARFLLDQARDRRGEVSAALARLQSDAQYMADTCLQELGVTRQNLLADPDRPRLAGEQLSQEDAVYRQMRAHLESMGPVNMMALEEYKETAQRHQFLETQRKDLLESIENTQNTIREIDTVSRQKFEEAFYAINQNFQRTFRKLFGGGDAFMRLTDEENSAESGIDVVASPPGKKLQNVLLLSGGEKAMTALALLVGIFQYQPSPFCILDEVDAPLDEANVGRFTDLVREMSVTTQFVLITHSKKTMSMAPVMYGVTMQEPGVSKLVAVRFGAQN